MALGELKWTLGTQEVTFGDRCSPLLASGVFQGGLEVHLLADLNLGKLSIQAGAFNNSNNRAVVLSVDSVPFSEKYKEVLIVLHAQTRQHHYLPGHLGLRNQGNHSPTWTELSSTQPAPALSHHLLDPSWLAGPAGQASEKPSDQLTALGTHLGSWLPEGLGTLGVHLIQIARDTWVLPPSALAKKAAVSSTGDCGASFLSSLNLTNLWEYHEQA